MESPDRRTVIQKNHGDIGATSCTIGAKLTELSGVYSKGLRKSANGNGIAIVWVERVFPAGFGARPRMRHITATEIDVAFVDEPFVLSAEDFVSGCQNCDDSAVIPFDYVLDAMTGCDPRLTEYLMYRLGKCPRCFGEINEKTLVAVA